jgi:hypothetical protein
MSDIKLFRLQSGIATELQGDASDLEKPLQTLIEANLGTLLGIRFLSTEYSTGKTHAGRIDSLGLDENNCPVILEYKRSVGENVINQGLFYLDWLMDHQAEFKLLVMEKLGKPAADAIDWAAPRLVCIAADFTKYDGHAVQQINRNIELIRYRRFGEELLLADQVVEGAERRLGTFAGGDDDLLVGHGGHVAGAKTPGTLVWHLASMTISPKRLSSTVPLRNSVLGTRPICTNTPARSRCCSAPLRGPCTQAVHLLAVAGDLGGLRVQVDADVGQAPELVHQHLVGLAAGRQIPAA